MNRLSETKLALTYLNDVVEPENYAEFLKAQYQIFYTIENKFGLPITDLFRSDIVLDDMAEIGIETLQSDLENVKRYVEYLKTLEWETVVPHIIVNYGFLLNEGQRIRHRVPGSGRMYDFGTPKMLEWIQSAVGNLNYDEYSDEVNYAADFVSSIHNDIMSKTI